MPASWVAASVRAKLLSDRRLGRGGAARLASAGDLETALETLAGTTYGQGLEPGLPLAAAQRRVAATALWQLRVLAGWLPPGGTTLTQPFAAWYEIANIEDRLAYLAGAESVPPYDLGRLAVAWPAVSGAGSAGAVRDAVAASRWGDPGVSAPAAMLLALRFRWAAWVGSVVPGTGVWAAAAVALLAARVRLLAPDVAAELGGRHAYGLPAGWTAVASVAELAAMLPRGWSWVLDGVRSPEDLWRAEAAWWRRVGWEASRSLVRSAPGPGAVVAAIVLLGYDAWLVRAALAAAARGRAARAVFDAVA